MANVFIYALKDPKTGEIRYVGKASNPKRRFKHHVSVLGQTRRSNWIRSLKVDNLKPTLEIVDEVPESEWRSAEAAYIEFYKDSGCDLVNGTNGGDGFASGKDNPMFGRNRSGEKAAHFGKKHSTESKEKMRLSHLGKKLSSEHVANMSAVRVGKKNSPEHCANISRAVSLVWEKRRQAAVLAEMWK